MALQPSRGPSRASTAFAPFPSDQNGVHSFDAGPPSASIDIFLGGFMKLRTFALTVVAACSLFACDQIGDKISDVLPELTLGGEDGIPPVSGSTKIDVPADFMCGNPIQDPQKKYTITTEGTDQECLFTFDQDVTVLKAEEYASRPELKGAQLVKRVDIDVKKLGVADQAGNPVQPKDLTGTAFGSTILTIDDLAKTPPFTKSIEGEPIAELKTLVQNKQDIVIPVRVQILVNMAPAPPTQIALDFDAQPNLVFGF
jgi:hypothetical protein